MFLALRVSSVLSPEDPGQNAGSGGPSIGDFLFSVLSVAPLSWWHRSFDRLDMLAATGPRRFFTDVAFHWSTHDLVLVVGTPNLLAYPWGYISTIPYGVSWWQSNVRFMEYTMMQSTGLEKDAAAKKKIVNRLRRAHGQLAAVINAVEDDAHCAEIVQQLSAVSKAVDRAGFLVISSALQECLTDGETQDGDIAQLEKLFLSFA